MRIGLTGGIGCGKSTVLELFKRRGFHVVSTDAIASDLLASDQAVIRAVAERYEGRGVVDGEGRIDRGALAALVFADPEELQWLEALLHPRIHQLWRDGLPGDRPSIVEIPLLFEKGLADLFDVTVCVETDWAVVIERLRDRGLRASQIEARAARQWVLARKIEAADYVLSNNVSRDALALQVDDFIGRLESERVAVCQRGMSPKSKVREVEAGRRTRGGE